MSLEQNEIKSPSKNAMVTDCDADDTDENLHKQKQQKFDKTIDITSIDSLLNNNDADLGE